jgi:hypothetical protein
LSANKKDWKAARAGFQIAAREYKGSGAMSSDFGGVPDQAAYQAAVCLVPQGKTKEAEAEFVKFLRDWPESPLTSAAYKRLLLLNGGKPKPEWEALLQRDISAEDAKVKFETSVCGPKALAYVLPLVKPGVQHPDYKALAKICGTKESGTSILSMRSALGSLGVRSYAYRLNRADLSKTKLPAILLDRDHYVVLLEVGDRQAKVYDSRFESQRNMPLPAADDPDFSIDAIAFSPLETR